MYELAGYALPDGDGPVLDVVPLFESGDGPGQRAAVLTGDAVDSRRSPPGWRRTGGTSR